MRTFIIHLLLSAYVAPLIGGFLVMTFPLPERSTPVQMEATLLAAFFAPWLTWYVFVPVGLGSFLFFRLTATARHRSLLFWIIAWCVIGILSANILAIATGANHGIGFLSLVGFLVGGLIAPLHRWLWRQLYEYHFASVPST